MGWKTSAALLGLSFIGLGSLVYLLFNKDEEADDCLVFPQGNSVLEVKVPKEIIGIVIGRGGQTLKEIEFKSNTSVRVKDDKSSDNLKVCVIRGTPESAQYAECLIHEIIVSQPLIETYEMRIPDNACGKIMGKGGENIRMICRSSNAKLIVERSPGSSVTLEKKLIIKGTPEQISMAKMLVEQKLEEETAYRNMLETQLSNRPPRNRGKYLLPAKGEGGQEEEGNKYSRTHKEKFMATGSGGLLEVYVSALESPDRLWLQMRGPCTVDLDRLNEQMSDYYSEKENKERHKLKEVKCGQIVAAPFAFDSKWYRAEVIDVLDNSEENKVKLYYVDYGDTYTCKKENLYRLRTDFLRLRFQAVECRLAKIKPRGPAWSEEAIDFLEDLTHVALWKALAAKIHKYEERPAGVKREGSPVPCVELYDTHRENTINVAEEMVKKGFADWEEETPKKA